MDPWSFGRLNKTQKRVSRPYGGYLCHECLRKLMKERARAEAELLLKNIGQQ